MTSTSLPSPSRSRRRWLAPLALALPVLFTAGSAAAYIIAVVPNAVKIPAPPDVRPPVIAGPDIYVFDEQQDVMLPAAVAVDARPINLSIQMPGDLNPGVIPAGTCVRSHYLWFRPGPFASATNTGAFETSDDIIGIELRQASLDATNPPLAAPGTTYPVAADCAGTPNHQCGVELLPEDSVRLERRRVQVSLTAGSPGDRIRVITRSCGCAPWAPDPNAR